MVKIHFFLTDFSFLKTLLSIRSCERKIADHDDKILLIFEYLKQLEQAKQHEPEQNQRKRIGFKRDDHE